MADIFDTCATPTLPADMQRIREQRAAMRLICAQQARGRTKAQRRADLRMLLDLLDLWPSADPVA